MHGKAALGSKSDLLRKSTDGTVLWLELSVMFRTSTWTPMLHIKVFPANLQMAQLVFSLPHIHTEREMSLPQIHAERVTAEPSIAAMHQQNSTGLELHERVRKCCAHAECCQFS